MDLIKIHLSEVSELEPLVISSLEKIEEGLKPLEHQLSIGTSGRPDILAVDINVNGALVLLELKSNTADTSAIGQNIRFYEWFAQNLALVARPFPTVKPDEGIRLFIIAPNFDEDAIRVAKYLDLDISLVKYIGLKNKRTEEVGLVFEKLELEPVEGPGAELRSMEDIVSYFVDKSLLDDFRKVLEDLNKAGIECRPYKGGKNYWIECIFEGNDVAYLQPRQRYFNCQVYDDNAEKYIWPPRRMESYDQWVKECRDEIVKYTKKEEGT